MYSSTLSLTSALDWVGDQRHAPAALPRERPGTRCVRGLVGPRAAQTGAENLASTGIRSPDRPAPSESLYQLHYPDPQCLLVLFLFFTLILIL